MKFRLIAAAAVVLMTTSFAQAAFNADDIAAQYQSDGYTRIEIKIGLNTAKVEAFRGTTKIEVTYDLASGTVIKTETETFANAPNVTPGVFVRTESESGRGSDDDGDDDGDDHGGDDSGHHSGSDDSGSDDSGHHGGDDDNSGHGSNHG